MHLRKLSGFTLIELSIVIVIIGLIAGGILVGRELIFAAEVRAQVSQIRKYDAAVNTFRLKYDCIPGDCVWAVDSGLGAIGAEGDDGDGNGIIDRDVNSVTGMEVINFWYHLSQADLIKYKATGYRGNIAYKPGIDTPPLQLLPDNSVPPEGPPADNNINYNPQGGVWVFTITDAPELQYVSQYFDDKLINKPIWLLINNAGSTSNRYGAYTAWRAYALDAKFDDGLPRTGVLRSRPFTLRNISAGQWGGWSCIEEFGNIYKFDQSIFAGNSAGCITMIQAMF